MGQARSGSGTPGSRNSRGGYPGLGYLPVLPYTGQYFSTPEKNSANRDGAEERSVPCPDDPRNQWQFFDKIEQNEKRKWRSECICCGQMYWDFTPSKILEHFGFQSTRQTAAKFKP